MGYKCKAGEPGECEKVMEGLYDGLTECKLACISDKKKGICKTVGKLFNIDLCHTDYLEIVAFIILVWIGVMLY